MKVKDLIKLLADQDPYATVYFENSETYRETDYIRRRIASGDKKIYLGSQEFMEHYQKDDSLNTFDTL